MNNDYYQEAIHPICRGGACSSRNLSDQYRPYAKQMNPVGRGLAPAVTSPINATQPQSKSHLYDEAVRRERRTLQNVHLLNGLCSLTNALPREQQAAPLQYVSSASH